MTEWYWCLTHNRAEDGANRDDVENALGPYNSEEEARHWRERVEARNEAWQIDDDRWAGDDHDDQDR